MHKYSHTVVTFKKTFFIHKFLCIASRRMTPFTALNVWPQSPVNIFWPVYKKSSLPVFFFFFSPSDQSRRVCVFLWQCLFSSRRWCSSNTAAFYTNVQMKPVLRIPGFTDQQPCIIQLCVKREQKSKQNQPTGQQKSSEILEIVHMLCNSFVRGARFTFCCSDWRFLLLSLSSESWHSKIKRPRGFKTEECWS